MKRYLVCLLAFSFALVCNVIAGDTAPVSKCIKVTTPFYNLTIQGHLEVVLVHDASPVVTLEGRADDLEAIAIQNDNNGLVLTVNKRWLKQKVVIHIPLQQVSAINLQGEIRLSTNDVITSKELRVFIDGNCRANLKATGVVNVTHADDCDVIYFNNNRKVV